MYWFNRNYPFYRLKLLPAFSCRCVCYGGKIDGRISTLPAFNIELPICMLVIRHVSVNCDTSYTSVDLPVLTIRSFLYHELCFTAMQENINVL
jgi:hypothetical protein